MRTRIKICGIRDDESALAAVEAGADALGFVFVKRSPRYIEPSAAYEIVSALPPFVSSVSLFQNCPIEEFLAAEERCPTTVVQLHGTEDESTVEQCGPAIKAVRFDADTIAEELERWDAHEAVDAILIDGSWGGEGVSFDWDKLTQPARSVSKPIILAGGLTPQNVAEAIRIVRPYGVDVSSGVERERGIKDHELIRAFCAAVQEAD